MRSLGLSPRTGSCRCRLCNGLIVWARNDKGRDMPIDYVNSDREKGTHVLYFLQEMDGSAVDGIQYVAPVPTHYQGPVWTCHFTTCPSRQQQPEKRRGPQNAHRR